MTEKEELARLLWESGALRLGEGETPLCWEPEAALEEEKVRQIVDEVKKVTGLPFTETVMPRRAGDPPHLIGSPKRINEEMGWHAKYDVEDIVESAWNAWQANPDHHIDVETWKQAD